jgi:hypothetical protein
MNRAYDLNPLATSELANTIFLSQSFLYLAKFIKIISINDTK